MWTINAECERREGYSVIEKLINEEENNNNFYRAFCDENYSMLFNGDLKIFNLQKQMSFLKKVLTKRNLGTLEIK